MTMFNSFLYVYQRVLYWMYQTLFDCEMCDVWSPELPDLWWWNGWNGWNGWNSMCAVPSWFFSWLCLRQLAPLLFRESHGPAAFVVAHEIPAFQEQLLILTSSCREGLEPSFEQIPEIQVGEKPWLSKEASLEAEQNGLRDVERYSESTRISMWKSWWIQAFCHKSTLKEVTFRWNPTRSWRSWLWAMAMLWPLMRCLRSNEHLHKGCHSLSPNVNGGWRIEVHWEYELRVRLPWIQRPGTSSPEISSRQHELWIFDHASRNRGRHVWLKNPKSRVVLEPGDSLYTTHLGLGTELRTLQMRRLNSSVCRLVAGRMLARSCGYHLHWSSTRVLAGRHSCIQRCLSGGGSLSSTLSKMVSKRLWVAFSTELDTGSSDDTPQNRRLSLTLKWNVWNSTKEYKI